MNMKNLRVTVMGLGLHGGGAAAARFCVSRGAKVTVTDLRDAATLESSLDSLQDLDIRYVLGEHRREDFTDCDLIVKNPAVPRNAPLLRLALEQGVAVETDISLFLRNLKAMEEDLRKGGDSAHAQVVGITGTKGKSSTTSALHHALRTAGVTSFMGGNITISPLLFLDDIRSALEHHAAEFHTLSGPGSRRTDPRRHPWVVLELSSFQIGDLHLVGESGSGNLFSHGMHWPDWGILTNIFVDHQDYYGNMESYVADKRSLFSPMNTTSWSIIGNAGEWTPGFLSAAGGNTVDAADEGVQAASLLPEKLLVPGEHQTENLKLTALLLEKAGFAREEIPGLLVNFPGVEHRLQFLGELGMESSGMRCRVYNDSAATIPEACLAAVEAFNSPVFLLCGGSDKGLDPGPIISAMNKAEKSFLLEGSGSVEISKLIHSSMGGTPANPVSYSSMEAAVQAAVQAMQEFSSDHPGSDPESGPVLLLSPGCASFGMFLNEFHRGRQFIAAVEHLKNFIPVPQGPA
ncbi:UDP-N-acetylmuramoylalanine--D-glutamate ligase [Salinispira pacifica]|uniref:UDP-N-acetylmuramoylalanine--D-glutamate ligase n=2 Tax=Salinispira pacifica TaxID=1307761 RepID=V5WIK2_9SPIO|nr:UDP-N-acetylmuramoylalanine--D-glutamate ligase [Salinispira pacifica]